MAVTEITNTLTPAAGPSVPLLPVNVQLDRNPPLGQETSQMILGTLNFTERANISAQVALTNFNCSTNPVCELNITGYIASPGQFRSQTVSTSIVPTGAISNIDGCIGVTYRFFLLVGPNPNQISTGYAQGVLTVFVQTLEPYGRRIRNVVTPIDEPA